MCLMARHSLASNSSKDLLVVGILAVALRARLKADNWQPRIIGGSVRISAIPYVRNAATSGH